MPAPVCDLVLLSWNQWEETKRCLESLFNTTTVACRLIIVDNGSAPSVRRQLEKVRPRGEVKDVRLIQNETNEGFPRGMNRGMRASKAPFVCLLNNDIEFTDGWLEEMLRVAESEPLLGLLNPMSSTFGHHPPKGMSLEQYAQTLRDKRGQYVEMGKCTGFCLLIKRAVLDQVGLFDETIDRFFFEDEDLCMRAQDAGFLCGVAVGAYVYHAEHRSVRLVPDREAVFRKNQAWCERKWGRWVRIAWPHFRRVSPGSDELRTWMTRLREWARRRAYIYVYAPTPEETTRNVLFRSVGLHPHADLYWNRIPERGAGWMAAWKILKRRKKPFDLIVAPTEAWRRRMASLRWWHGAPVVAEDDEDALRKAWEHIRQVRRD